MRTSFNHQPEAQHPKHPAIRWAADYPIFGSNTSFPSYVRQVRFSPRSRHSLVSRYLTRRANSGHRG
jgi:hypothetical protein